MKIAKYLLVLILISPLTSCNNKIHNNKNSTKEKFLPNNSDIPLFLDFKAIDDETLNFDSSSGNISNITYKSKAKISDIQKYYKINLKNLGWNQIDKSINYASFTRGSEILKISYDKIDKDSIIKFFIIKTNG
ncbi:MAG: hypothetical protein ACI9IL_000263 [Rickettsiales bacterium]|jgi:hypothetical protein